MQDLDRMCVCVFVGLCGAFGDVLNTGSAFFSLWKHFYFNAFVSFPAGDPPRIQVASITGKPDPRLTATRLF